MQENVELVDGKFVVKGKKEKEVKPSKPKVVSREYSEEVIALRERVILGNQKLFDAWNNIKKLDHESQQWKDEFERWHQACERLSLLCTELKVKGYEDCLYLENGKRTRSCLSNPDGFWCQVCPSTPRYWDKEFDDL